MYFSFALAGHRGTCLRPLHIFALLFMRPSSLGGGRIMRRTLSVCLSVCLSVYPSVPLLFLFILQ